MRRSPRPVLAAILILIALFLGVAATLPDQASAAAFLDVPDGHPARAAIESLGARDIIAGTTDGRFLPDGPLARGQAAKILIRWQGEEPGLSEEIAFRDLDATYIGYVERAAALGWLLGYPDGSFKPYNPLTREQLAVIVMRSLGQTGAAQALSDTAVNEILRPFADAGSISPNARRHVALAVQWRLFSGDNGRLNPLLPITRAQFCMVLTRAETHTDFTNNRQELAAFMDTYLFAPRNSPITGEMVLQNVEWYGIPAIVQLVILAAETGLGDPVAGGELARRNNFGCLRNHGATTSWGELSDGVVWVAGVDWYSFPSAQIGMMAFGRYLKAGVNGYYLTCFSSGTPDWRRFATVYFGQGVAGFEEYVARLQGYEDKYRSMAAEQGLSL